MHANDQQVGFVYFIHAPSTGLIKIGFSASHPIFRLSALNSSSPEPLHPLAFMRGGAGSEKELHARFKDHRRRGEWFEDCESIRAFIRESAEAWSAAEPGDWSERNKRIWDGPWPHPRKARSARPRGHKERKRIAELGAATANAQYRAIKALSELGWSRREISLALRIGEATFYRRVADIKEAVTIFRPGPL